MQKINPSVQETLNQEVEIFTSTYKLYKREIEHIREAITIEDGERVVFSIPKIISLRLDGPVLFELLIPFGYTLTEAQNIIFSLNSESGKTFRSGTYILLKDRNTLIISKNKDVKPNQEYEIPESSHDLKFPLSLSLKKKIRTSDFQIPSQSSTVALDADKITFPLKLRKWNKGDYFIPLGMIGRKKLSDFFIDRKINLLDKEEIWVLTSEEEIIWVVGQQIDDRYKIKSETKNILLISLKH